MADTSRPPALDPQMQAFLAAAGDSATRDVDVFTADIGPLRRAVEASRAMPPAGPAVARTEEFWVRGSGRHILCRLNAASTEAPGPVLVWLHGGGWTWNSIYGADRTAREFAQHANVTVVAVDYSLAPEYKFPLALNECVDTVRWIAAEGHERGLDGSRILIGGDSAGANLALGTALALRDTGHEIFKGAVLFYGVYDSDFSRESYRRYGRGDLPLTERNMRFFWSNYTSSPDQRLHPYAAPLRSDLRGLPPLWVGVAEFDVLADESRLLAEKATAAGVDVAFSLYNGLPHGFLRAIDHVDKVRRALSESAAWLRDRISGARERTDSRRPLPRGDRA